MNTIRLARMALLVALMLPAIAVAQVDPDPNGVGIYFDEGATQTSLIVDPIPPGGVVFSAWLIATRVSVPGYLRYLRGHVDWEEVSYLSSWSLIDLDECQEMPVPQDDELCAWFEPGALATGQAMILKRYDLAFWNDLAPGARFYVRSMRLTLTSGVEIALHPSSGDPNLPVAVINDQAPVAAESATWGAVKSLYR